MRMLTDGGPGRASLAFREAVSAAADLLLPRYCCVCSSAGAFLCQDCRARIEPVPRPFCPRCCRPGVTRLCPDCDDPPKGLLFACHAIRAVTTYEDPVTRALHLYKYQSMKCLADGIGLMLRDWLEAAGEDWRQVDAVAHVPPALGRKWALGYDHTGLLAGDVAAMLGVPHIRPVVRRSGPAQVGKTRDERLANARKQYALRNPEANLTGMRVLLIDDVVTTGATVHTVAGLMRSAGAQQVRALVVARNA